MKEIDVCIIGAGPGGATAALKLNQLGIPSLLIDKAVFPRDKICGDALSGKVVTILKRIDPKYVEAFDKFKKIHVNCWGIKYISPNQYELDIPFNPKYNPATDTTPAYVSKRLDFDNFLVDQVKECPLVELQEGVAITEFEKTKEGYIISDKSGSYQVKCKILLVANGAYSAFTRKEAGIVKENLHYAGGIRAYYEGVDNLDKDNFIELHFLKEFLPGYLWIFPLPNGQANVGAGMLSEEIVKNKVKLKESMLDLLQNHPKLKDRFKNAKLIGKIQGFGLPLGSKKRSISGDNYMLLGDAASLIDPFSGEGIGNALYCGFYAGLQVERCLKEQNYSAQFMKKYDDDIERVMGRELRFSHKLQMILFKYPWLFNLLSRIAYSSRNLQEALSIMFMDMDSRESVLKPSFYFKNLFKR